MAEDCASAFQEKSKEKAFPCWCSMPKHLVIKKIGSKENWWHCYLYTPRYRKQEGMQQDAACWQMFYFSPALARGCHDAATSCNHFSASWYSWDKSVLLNTAPLKDLPLGIGMGPQPAQSFSCPGANSGTGNPAAVSAQASFKKRAVN